MLAAHEARAKFSPEQQPRLQALYERVRDAKNRRKGVGASRELTSFEQGQEKYKVRCCFLLVFPACCFLFSFFVGDWGAACAPCVGSRHAVAGG